ncbi:hypothetical protein GCM10023232_18780 [Sphingosinicella ginsenosidimutans]|uniref:Uncharacterized protein n=1 Tax=Allosphingosinicella ginsenosidimutans TaxID=1176539 RepID=A0A5C6TR41_9SPHN|nr:hypothetical protein [Sphingosinicella ginsenosidimutans]TXC62922.1 hypothetical protein FRZ32_04105 [Sphingosinicella ginsenosidimutans]
MTADSPEKIAIFIRTLRATGSVTDAARAAGTTRKTAYDLYGREDAGYFRAAWDEGYGASLLNALICLHRPARKT